MNLDVDACKFWSQILVGVLTLIWRRARFFRLSAKRGNDDLAVDTGAERAWFVRDHASSFAL